DFQPEVLDRVAQKLLRFYNELLANAGKNPYGNSENIRHTLEEITHGFDLLPTYGLPKWSEKILKEYLFGFLDDNAELLERRVQQGRIGEGHGDLRSEHIHITGQEVNMYDCLEFDEKLRTLDWLNDIAFLLMDLDYRHRHDLALHLEKTWLSALENEDVSTLLTFYKTYRACVRGKVNGLKSAETEVPPSIREESRQKALSYYQLALRYAQLGSKPTILLCMGGVASGKSTLAKELAACFNLTHLNSDLVRKQQAGLDPYTRLHDSERTKLYSQERTERVYESMLIEARQEIQKNGAVVLDATYRHEAQFARLADYCTSNEYRLLTIHTTAPADVVIQRLKNRDTEPSVSDMRLSDYHTGTFEPDFDPAGIAPVVLTVVTDTPVEVLVRDQVLPWIRNQARSITN
ncbi:MAG: AAA family ATPase, partial [Bacteroidetes bacterium]|nr:AAA family ATPase [Bacteroidota bacterium]